MTVCSLGYLRFDATDIPAWRTFGEDFLGLMRVDGADPDSLYFRLDEYPPRLVISPADTNRGQAIGFEVRTRRELESVMTAVGKWGIDITEGTDEQCSERRVTRFVHFTDPAGNPVELFYGPVLDHVPVQTPLVSKFVAGPLGVGHVIVTAEDADAAFEFYTEALGFFERNTMKTPNGTLYFLGCNPRHHTLGIAPAPGPGRVVHFMFEGETIDDVGRAVDRAAKYDIPMMQTMGKHTNDHMVSFYVYSPENYAVEFGFGGLQVPEPGPTYEITEGAFWGHRHSPPPQKS